MKLQDYIHLYIGCECQLFFRYDDKKTLEYERNGILKIIRPEDRENNGLGFECRTVRNNIIYYSYSFSDVKPILRHLSDITEMEFIHVCNMLNWNTDEYDIEWFKSEYIDTTLNFIYSFELTRYLLSQGFDLFNLIENGLALDKRKL